MMQQGIHSKRCWINGRLQEATILFNNGIITSIGIGVNHTLENTTDVGNNILMPGIIDAHVHINEPGRTDWEGFDTATKAAAAGGITSIVDMPLNASPVTTTLDAFNLKLESTNGKMHVHGGFYGGLIPGNVNDIEALLDAGVLGIKAFLTHSGIDEFPNVGVEELNAIMPLLARRQVPLLVHCELSDDVHGDELLMYPDNYKSYLSSRPKEWENKAVQMMIDLCRIHQCPTHIVHVSSADCIPIIKAAKAEGLPLTAETCPQYIYFNAEEIPDSNTLFKCAPPIREKENNDLLKQALKHKVLDFITTDHSPAPSSIKEIETGNLLKAWGGIAGLQFLLPASWTGLKNVLTLTEVIPLLTEKPAEFLKLNGRKGFLKEGFDADFVVWSDEESFHVKEENIFHKHKASPYVGRQLFGVIHSTYVNGKLVYDGQQIINKNQGQWLLKK